VQRYRVDRHRGQQVARPDGARLCRAHGSGPRDRINAAEDEEEIVSGIQMAVGSARFSAGGAMKTFMAFDSNNTPYISYDDCGNGERATVMSNE
jgi:hypothetical protein